MAELRLAPRSSDSQARALSTTLHCLLNPLTGEKTEVQQGSITCMMTGSSSHGNIGPSDSCSALSCFLLSLSPLILLFLMETRSRKKAWERERIKDNEASLSSLDHRIPSQTGYWHCPPTLFNMLVSPPYPRLTEQESQRLVQTK